MAGGKDFAEAHHSLIDPLIEPDPSDETGLNTRFGSTYAAQKPPSPPPSAGPERKPPASIRHQHTGSTNSTVETNPYRRSRQSSASKGPSVTSHRESTPVSRQSGYPSPPQSAGSRRTHVRNSVSEDFGANHPRTRRSSQPASNPFASPKDKGLTRGGSLSERYPGDTSHRPLDAIRKDEKSAHRAHHLRKKNFQSADVIDRLDKTGFSYHHEGPYDAANLSRNRNWKHSPVAAVADSNDEALKATPRENVVDALTKHRPIDGVAFVPPGFPDEFGRVYDYEEGADLHREPGYDYKRWGGVTYHPDDLKGKGEPSFTIDKALKDHKKYGDEGTELMYRSRRRSMGSADAAAAQSSSIPMESLDAPSGLGRSNTTGKRNSFKARFGSLRRRKAEAA